MGFFMEFVVSEIPLDQINSSNLYYIYTKIISFGFQYFNTFFNSFYIADLYARTGYYLCDHAKHKQW